MGESSIECLAFIEAFFFARPFNTKIITAGGSISHGHYTIGLHGILTGGTVCFFVRAE
jgi:hypothetical protein